MAFVRLRQLFHKHRLIGNVVVYTGLLSGADAFCQVMQRRLVVQGVPEQRQSYDYARTGRMAAIGSCFYGPYFHYVYHYMDKLLPGTAVRTVAIKCAIDQCGVTVFSLAFFYVGMSLLEGKTIEEAKQELQDKYAATYMSSLLVWPAAQAVNFAVIPAPYRVVYISTVAFFWTVFLSYIKNKKERPKFLQFVDKMTAATKSK